MQKQNTGMLFQVADFLQYILIITCDGCHMAPITINVKYLVYRVLCYLDIFHAMDFRSSEHSEEKVYIQCITYNVSCSMVSIRTGVASNKQLVQVSRF